MNYMDVKQVKKLNELIKKGRTGNPQQLSEKLGVSERTVYNYINYLKNELHAPIAYNPRRETYEYQDAGEIKIEWWINKQNN